MSPWQPSSESDISKCSLIPSSIHYQEVVEEEEEPTNDDSSFKRSYKQKKNRMAIANQDLKPGDIVLRNAPLACSLMLSDDNTSKHCAYCFASEQKLSRCARCQSVWYCSRDCQKLDFALHKKECLYWAKTKKTATAQSFHNGRIQAEISLLIRTHAKIEQQQQDEASSFPQTTSPQTTIHSRIQHLASLTQYPFSLDPSEESIIQEATTAILWFQQEQQAKNKWTRNQTKPEIQQQVQDLLRIFRVNNFGITDEMLKVIASAVYPLGALLNHSCRPNCILRYHTSTKSLPVLEIVACRPINKGEELTHSYVELVQAQPIRQERLKSNYGFDCQCPRCITAATAAPPTVDPLAIPKMPKDWMQLHDVEQVRIFLDYCNPCYPSHQEWTANNNINNIPKEDNNTMTHDQATQLQQMATHLQAQAKQYMAMDDIDGEIQSLRQSLAILTKLLQAQWNPETTALEVYQVRGDLLGSLLLAGQTELAIRECEYVVAFLVSILCSKAFCPNHPILGLQLFTLGDLYSGVDWDEQAQRTFAWARTILMVSHGSNSNMVQLLKDR